MSAFIDPDAKIEKTFACPCPPLADGSRRHPSGDTVTAKAAIGMADMARLQRALFTPAGTDPFAQQLTLLEVALLDWTFTDAKGEAVPIDPATIAILDPTLGTEIATWVDAELSKAKLPNAVAARSPRSSRASSSGRTTKGSPKP